MRAQAKTQPDDSFVVLLKGLYQPVTHGPNLGLSMVDLNDGSYSTTRIYPVQGTPGGGDPNKPVGDFYVQFDGDSCAYHIPGGSFSMRFTAATQILMTTGRAGGSWKEPPELTILEGTGIYKPFVDGHNHMVDKLHFLAPATAPAASTSTASASSAANETTPSAPEPRIRSQIQGGPVRRVSSSPLGLTAGITTAGFKRHSRTLAHANVASPALRGGYS